MIANGADVNGIRMFLVTPLHDAIEKNNYELCLLLIQNGAFINAKDVDGMTALHDSITLGHYDLTLLLLQCGATNIEKDVNEMTPYEKTLSKPDMFGKKILMKYCHMMHH